MGVDGERERKREEEREGGKEKEGEEERKVGQAAIPPRTKIIVES